MGDIFTLKLRTVGFFWGRVVGTDAMCPMSERLTAILIYVYGHICEDKTPPETLRRQDILLEPILINHLPWGRGYFETVANWPIREGDVYDRHCFKDTIYKTPRYYDEFGNEVPEPFEPCSFFGLSSYGVVDDELSEYAGIPLADERK